MGSTVKKTIEIIIRGRVQGVGFRYSCRIVARELGVCGLASNQLDGSVHVIASATEEALDQFQEWLKKGPPGALVESVESSESELETPAGAFEIR